MKELYRQHFVTYHISSSVAFLPNDGESRLPSMFSASDPVLFRSVVAPLF